MKKLAIAISLLALAYTASSPARADFGVVKFKTGYCRVWADTAVAPWGGRFVWFHHRHHWWHYRFATWQKADWKLHKAVAWHRCQHWWLGL